MSYAEIIIKYLSFSLSDKKCEYLHIVPRFELYSCALECTRCLH